MVKPRDSLSGRSFYVGPDAFIKIESICGHSELLTASILVTAGVNPYETILDLQYKLRCRECDVRGRAVISIRVV
jgi:hypothetical protein